MILKGSFFEISNHTTGARMAKAFGRFVVGGAACHVLQWYLDYMVQDRWQTLV